MCGRFGMMCKYMFDYWGDALSGITDVMQYITGGVVAALLTIAPGLGLFINSPTSTNTQQPSVTCGFGRDIGGGQCRGYLTSGSIWTVPADWNNTNNTIDTIGGGGSGGASGGDGGGTGGGGGAFARKSSIILTNGSVISYSVGNGSVTDTWFYSPSTLLAKGANGSLGGSASASVGDLKYSGGNGGIGFSYCHEGGVCYAGGGGGGGAASMYGSPNTCGSGGGVDACGSTRPTGKEYDATHGSGLGGGGGYAPPNGVCMMADGQIGGLYGGGGGGAATDIDCPPYVSSGIGGAGAPGLIVITYASIANTTPDPYNPPTINPPNYNPGELGGDGVIDIRSCSGNMCNASGTKVVNSCTGAVVEDCTEHGAGWYCSGSVCTVRIIGFEDFDATSDAGPFRATGHLEVMPRLVSNGSRVRLYWNAVNAQSCNVTGTNNDSWNELSSGTQGQLSSKIVGRTTYTLFCRAYEGAIPATINEQIVVNIVPMFQEQ